MIGALQVNQIDVAIAAITITPARQELVDFSDVYCVGEEAVVAREDSTIESLRFVEDLSDKSIGVERGSVYENWVEDNLIEPGLMPASNLLSFVDIGQAIA